MWFTEKRDNLDFQYSCNNMPDTLRDFQEIYIDNNEKEISFEEFLSYINDDYFCECGQTWFSETNVLLEMIRYPQNFSYYYCRFNNKNIVYYTWSAIEFYFFDNDLLDEMENYLID